MKEEIKYNRGLDYEALSKDPDRLEYSETSDMIFAIFADIKDSDMNLLLKENGSLESQKEIIDFQTEIHSIMVIILNSEEGHDKTEAYIQENLAIGKLVHYHFYNTGELQFEDRIGYHLFSSMGVELTKDSMGEVLNCHVYSNGAYEFEDEAGYHLFSSKGVELTKDTVGKVSFCQLESDEVYEFEDEIGAHSFSGSVRIKLS